ncbi:sensor histidine kinase [Flavobacterium sp. 3HN19-14]|uniref:sensor histidine kinase n=1 Tax=Flavobacterium sp. 3HN19-14 TaxID=3448133 RepID=UPI003EE26D4A
MAGNPKLMFVIRSLAILIALFGAFFLYQHQLLYTSFFLLLVAALLITELIYAIKNTFTFYDKTIQAILNDDFSADFSAAKAKNHQPLFELYERLKTTKNEQFSKDLVYRSILNNIETGIVILKMNAGEKEVFLMNDYFSSHFKVPKVSKWTYLKNQLPSLCTIIEEREFGEIKTSVQITVDRQDTQTFILQASATKTVDGGYYIIMVDSIQKVIEKTEKESWINLMKVISHELLNSITPIRSLTQNLNELVLQDTLSKDDIDDIRQSVNTILNRSDHLQEFVESYRKLAMLPTPVKEKIDIQSLFSTTLELMAPAFKKQNITVTNTIDYNKRIFADRLQMEQVLINLLTNSIYALEDKTEKYIEITSESRNNRIFITITDTGSGIEKEIEDKIFLPFFTTRKDGAGIGLTLSKNIVEAHGGYLSCVSESEHTKFVICLIE